MKKHKSINQIFTSPAVLGLIIIIIAYLAYIVSNVLIPQSNFGSVVSISKIPLEIQYLPSATTITIAEIEEHITSPAVLETIKTRYNLEMSEQDLLNSISVKQNSSNSESFVIIVKIADGTKSNAIASDLGFSFINQYQKKLNDRYKHVLDAVQDNVELIKKDIVKFQKIHDTLTANKDDFFLLSGENELTTINEQLVAAQQHFVSEYREYLSRLENVRFELQLKYDLEKNIYTTNNLQLSDLKIQLAEINTQYHNLEERLLKIHPNIYRMTLTYPPLLGAPRSITYLYENIKTLQHQKFSIFLESKILEKNEELRLEESKFEYICNLINNNNILYLEEVLSNE